MSVDDELALGIHDSMFIAGLERLATDEQKAKWLKAAKQYKIIGTYAQTELGHGTFLRGLKTTATYDPKTQEFILNTPSVSAMKWWPGALGKSANHAIVFATLIIGDKKYGMQPFFVQLRSTEDHQPLPGRILGMIGNLMGRITSDNGFLIMDNIRIPRGNMLMKNAQVSPDGKFTSSAPSKANYATMVLIRVQIACYSYYFLSKSATIAIRYSAVRRQSKIDPKEKEPKILEFQTQQYKLFPGLAMAYAFVFVSRTIERKYNEALQEIEKGNFESLSELHCESSGMKAFCTEIMVREMEIMRQACGGHGYLNAAGLAVDVTSATSAKTVEGENTVLYLQVARYLLKRFNTKISTQRVNGCTSYLSVNPALYSIPISSKKDCTNLQAYCGLYQHRAYMMIAEASGHVQNDVKKGIAGHDAVNRNLVYLLKAAKAHCYFCVVKDFVEAVEALKASSDIVKVMQTLCCFLAAHGVSEQSGDFIESGAVGLEQMTWIRETQIQLLGDIRPYAVLLVDAFDFHDISLSSAIGCYDGNAYERLFKSTMYDPLNKEEVHPSYYKYLKPFIEEMKAKL